jgi:serine/threonine protein kinase, bacterial
MKTTLLNNRYQVIQVLGAGGFGETFLAEDTHMPSRRQCVIKQLKPIANDPQTYQMIQQRFEREAATLEYLGKSSDQIPELYAYFSENGQFYLVQECIHGQTLKQLVQAKGYESEAQVREILLSLLPVLDYIHSRGIIHRDIKPENIILRSWDGKPVLIDFGAVKETIRSVVNGASYTQSMVIGTPGYMPSEQAIGRPVYATDIYSLGVTAIYLLTGKPPYELETNQQTGEIVWQNHAPQVSPNLVQIINQAIKPHASDRYTTASKMLYALQSSISNTSHTTLTIPPTIAKSTKQTEALPASPQISPSNWQKPAIIFGSLFLGSLLGAVAISSFNRTPQPEIPLTQNSPPPPESLATNSQPLNPPISASPTPTPTAPTPTPSLQVVPAPRVESNPVTASTPAPEIDPQPVATPTPEATTAPPQPETENPQAITPTPEVTPTPTPTPQNQPRNPASNRQTIPAFPTGTHRSTVEATLGKPKRDLRGLWPNTRAVVYKVVPNQVDLGYLFDRKTGALRQTEVAFAQSVEPQIMQATLNGMLGGRANAEIQQGLEQIRQRQADNFQFRKGTVKGQIVRQNCDLIYISIWDADLHDFVNPASAKRC